MTIERTSGSVFAALGHPDPVAAEAKSGLVTALNAIIDERGLTQVAAAKIVGVDQPTLSKILRGVTRSVSTDKLTEMINALGRDVVIVISANVDRSESNPRGRTSVVLSGEGDSAPVIAERLATAM